MVVSSAIRARQSRNRRGAPAENSGHSARRNAGRTDAPEIRHRHRRGARQDHHYFHDGERAGRSRARSHICRGRARESHRLDRAPRARRIHGRRSRRKRPHLSAARARGRRGDDHRPGAPGHVQDARGDSGNFHAVRQSRAVLRRRRALPRRAECPGHHSECEAPGHHLRHIEPGGSGDQRRRASGDRKRVSPDLSRRRSRQISFERATGNPQCAQCRRSCGRGAVSECARGLDSRRARGICGRGPAV